MEHFNEYLKLAADMWQSIAVGLLAVLIATLIWKYKRQEITLFWLGVRHRFPIFGKISRLAKQPGITDNWFHAETQICQDFKPHHQRINKSAEYYTACREYLDIVGETGRKPLTPLLVLILFAVLVLEAWGFSYTMSGFIDISASEDTRHIMAWILSFTFAVTLATVTHKMGHEIHRNKIIHNIRELWKADSQPAGTLTQQATVGSASIENPTDVNEAPYIRRLNRLELGRSHKTHGWTISAIAIIAMIAIILTFIRVKALETAQTQDSLCNVTATESAQQDLDFASLYSDAPAAVTSANSELVQQGQNELCKATQEGSWATFAMMGILFCVLQAFATWASTARGFAGKQSLEAWEFSHKFNTVEEFVIHYENKKREVVDFAQKSLTSLQTRMADKLTQVSASSEVNTLIKSSSERTFFKYLEKDHSEMVNSELARNVITSNAELQTAELSISKAASLNDIEEKAQTEADRKAEMRAKLMAMKAPEPAETQEEINQRLIEELEAELGYTLTEEQRQAVLN